MRHGQKNIKLYFLRINVMKNTFIFSCVSPTLMGLNLLIVEDSRSHSLDTRHLVGILWTSPLSDNTQHS